MPSKVEAGPIPTGTERILFIDDQESLAQLGEKIFEKLGYTVTTRLGSFDALLIFQDNPHQFDLVITDQTMAGMTGADLAVKMLQIRPDIPIILCTGYSSLITAREAKALGIKEFIMKPLIPANMARIVRKV
jgi:DNA-binding NtrC family response regulator